jgi:hypothetical protein
MAYIGAVAPGYDPTRASVPQLDAERFSGTGSATTFTLARQVVSPTDIDVVVENVTQEPTVAYSVNGNTLTFTEAPGSGTNNIYVVYRGSGISNYAFVPDGSITYAKLANNIKQFTVDAVTANGTGTTVELTEAPASANSIIVSVDGVIQTAPTNYTLSGSTITFTGTPDNGANVVVRHIGFRTTSTVTALQASSVTATELADSSVTNAKIVSVANTKISGNIVSSQIAPSVTLTTPIISGNLNLDSAGTSGIRLPAANTISFHTAGTEDMRIDSTGRVGIGVSSPAKALSVYAADGYIQMLNASTGTATGDGAFIGVEGGTTALRIVNQENDVMSFSTNGLANERMRIDASGRVLIGLTSPNASGANFQVSSGITFPATQSASSDANTLDDYEEGTWTPTLPNGGTLTNIGSFYTKIGRTVYVQLHLNSIAPTNNGSAFRIGGLPFTSTTNSGFYGGGCFNYVGDSNINGYLPIIDNNSTYFFFHQSTGTVTTISNSTYFGLAGSTKSMIINAWYITN